MTDSVGRSRGRRRKRRSSKNQVQNSSAVEEQVSFCNWKCQFLKNRNNLACMCSLPFSSILMWGGVLFVVSVVILFLNSPYDSHWDVVGRILRYILRDPLKEFSYMLIEVILIDVLLYLFLLDQY